MKQVFLLQAIVKSDEIMDNIGLKSFFEKEVEEMEYNLHFRDQDQNQSDKILNDYVFVDVQGFKGNHNRFICKEFCLIDGVDVFHELIRSPFPLNRLSAHLRTQANWLTRNFHGLNFEDGDLHVIN